MYFSCVAVLKQCIETAKRQVICALTGENDVTIFAMLRQQENEYSLIIEFSLLKSFGEKKRRWENKGYQLESFKRKSVQKNKPYLVKYNLIIVIFLQTVILGFGGCLI